MRPTYSADAGAYREKVQAFLAEKLPSGWAGMGALDGDDLSAFVREWRAMLFAAGYLAPGWPTVYGGAGLSALEQVIIAEEFAKAGVPTGGPNDVFSIQMLGNTLLQWGTDEQKDHYLPRILSGADTWCQGYSEPNAGSDLSNLGLRGVIDGDQWILNGQKIWTSAGHLADHIFTLVRTDPEAPRHKGISFILVDMRQPGIEVRPIKMISGWSEYHKIVTELALDILGAEAMTPTGRRPSTAFQTDDAGAPNSSWSWVGTFLNARAGTIYAGSSQIQRNIIGEMVLGLPKEPKADGGPWKDLSKRG